MSIQDEIQEYEKLIQLIRDTIQYDNDLRIKYDVAQKFRFVRDRLQGLLTHLEEQAGVLKTQEPVEKQEDVKDKTLAYVYLYNAQGALLRSWLTLLTPRVFYEYSINRPIYHERSFIESLIRTKANKQQHAYLTVKINQNDIISLAESAPKDTVGNPLVKIREGSLRFENLVMFTHNGQDYILNAQGEFVKK
ncbi:MAG TPA: type IVB secretion system protein IcmQ [Gammaproteobacteria bacterium]|nr:type IVB secretion system protein IcmQ [Gammaproteobacteria bacterium]